MANQKRTPFIESQPALGGYRIVWLIVLFDLPTATKLQRKAATRFRHNLLNEGFEMSQYSVYLRHCAGKEQADALARRIELVIPKEGKVHMIQITDKQYENIRTFRGIKREPSPKNPEQLVLF
ncbi:MAG: CRISPR-associated endonuclease Cas2 [Gemmatimonadota bacterium]|nr:CRISPR-associated endonuclease Cas2 [Gemmatimonadota bacterium]